MRLLVLSIFFFAVEEDIDGIPFEKSFEQSRSPYAQVSYSKPTFIPSKWETVDPQQIESQVIALRYFHCALFV